jgi:hypothetical protein
VKYAAQMAETAEQTQVAAETRDGDRMFAAAGA